jgi:uncharacterized membrane protein
MIRAAQLADPIFTDPVVAIVPRLFIGLAAWAVYTALRRTNEIVAIIAGALAGSLTNTVLVIGLLILTGKLDRALALGIGVTYGSAEAAVAAIITLAVVGAVRGIVVGRRQGANI